MIGRERRRRHDGRAEIVARWARAHGRARARSRARVALTIRARVDVNGSTRRRRRLARVRNRAPISRRFGDGSGIRWSGAIAQRARGDAETGIVEWDACVETNLVCVK